jgi:hypothetical protein
MNFDDVRCQTLASLTDIRALAPHRHRASSNFLCPEYIIHTYICICKNNRCLSQVLVLPIHVMLVVDKKLWLLGLLFDRMIPGPKLPDRLTYWIGCNVVWDIACIHMCAPGGNIYFNNNQETLYFPHKNPRFRISVSLIGYMT